MKKRLQLQQKTKSRMLLQMLRKPMHHPRMLPKMHLLQKKSRLPMPRQKKNRLLLRSRRILVLVMNRRPLSLSRPLNQPLPNLRLQLRMLLLPQKQSLLSQRPLFRRRKVNRRRLMANSLRLKHQQHLLSHLLIQKQKLRSSMISLWVNTKPLRLVSQVH
jgi:hypothetical protein